MVASLFLDVRHAWRGLRRSPGLLTTAVLTLSIGIGANLVVFGVVDAAILKPLPYTDPEQLVVMYSVYKRGTAEEMFFVNDLSWTRLDRWRQETAIFASIATYGPMLRVAIDRTGSAGENRVRAISPDVLVTFGVPPRLGRWFDATDLASGGAVVLLTERFWRRAFNGASTAVGQSLIVDGRPHAIVGVMPDVFGYAIGSRNTVGWVPYDEGTARLNPKATFGTVMRLRAGLTLEQAERDVDAATERMQRERATPSPYSVDLASLDSRSAYVSTRTALQIFGGAVTLLLLIACANVANLLLSRAQGRVREIAVRTALGASRGAIVRHLLAESIVVAGISGLASLVLTWWMTRLVPAWIPEDLNLFAANALTLDWRLIAYAFALVTVTTGLCSVIPALRATRSDVVSALEGSNRIAGASGRSRRAWQALQIAQILLTVILLTGAGLLSSSFIRMVQTEAGYDIDQLAVVYLDVPEGRYADRSARAALHDAILSRVRSLPGVEAAAYGASPPASGSGRVSIENREDSPGATAPALSLYPVGQDYFATVGIALKQGRAFSEDEIRQSANVVVVDERFARTYWPGESPLGKNVRFGLVPIWSTVIGVAGSVKTSRFANRDGTSQAYHPVPSAGSLIVRTGDRERVLPLVREALKAIDPGLDVIRASPVSDLYENALVTPRFYVTLMVAFAGIALLTAAVGLAAVVSQSVTRRVREIGVRMALGARAGQVRTLVMREALLPVGLGAAAGLFASLWLTRFLQAMLYQITPHDPPTYAAGLVCLALVAMVAALIPAQRAARVDPLQTLREQ